MLVGGPEDGARVGACIGEVVGEFESTEGDTVGREVGARVRRVEIPLIVMGCPWMHWQPSTFLL